MMIARTGAGVDDLSQLLPFLLRTWMYVSGVLFSLDTLSRLKGHHTLQAILQANPAAVYIDLVRNALLKSQRLSNPTPSRSIFFFNWRRDRSTFPF